MQNTGYSGVSHPIGKYRIQETEDSGVSQPIG
jgi:hypothetical protein